MTTETAPRGDVLTVRPNVPVITVIERFAGATSTESGTSSRPRRPAGRPEDVVRNPDVVRAGELLPSVLKSRDGFVAALLLAGLDGEFVVYSQWRAEGEPPEQVPAEWSVADQLEGFEPVDKRTYAVDFSAPADLTRFSVRDTPLAHFGVFSVNPDDQERMLELARKHAPDSLGTPGLLGVNFHRSLDGGQVVNLGAWTTFGGFDELLGRAGFRDEEVYWQDVAEFRPHFFAVVDVVARTAGELAIWATLKVLPGKQEEAERFFAFSKEVLDAEPGTTSFFAVKVDDETYGIFDTFTDQEALDVHIEGASGKKAVFDLVGTVFAAPPVITGSVVLQRGARS
ncbi:putative quinol monooxygenase [Lentzea albida]|uniref:Quinol monooxygenase YgiN n=1 Tax=Lentzea albida TaxID=65499 RepID=A0A1H9LYA2_9PSEU|nr:antibiotic biosynthesis monooxygenase [Lentzea albida]SER16432.1 Quinol monooxygenase YgiN [Lentzea albida]